jgi:hypothetical protein
MGGHPRSGVAPHRIPADVPDPRPGLQHRLRPRVPRRASPSRLDGGGLHAPGRGDLGVGAQAGAAQGDRRLGRHEVVQDQELNERQGLLPVQIGSDRVLAQPIGAQVRGEVQLFPDRLLDLGGDDAIHPARNADVSLGPDFA